MQRMHGLWWCRVSMRLDHARHADSGLIAAGRCVRCWRRLACRGDACYLFVPRQHQRSQSSSSGRYRWSPSRPCKATVAPPRTCLAACALVARVPGLEERLVHHVLYVLRLQGLVVHLDLEHVSDKTVLGGHSSCADLHGQHTSRHTCRVINKAGTSPSCVVTAAVQTCRHGTADVDTLE